MDPTVNVCTYIHEPDALVNHKVCSTEYRVVSLSDPSYLFEGAPSAFSSMFSAPKCRLAPGPAAPFCEPETSKQSMTTGVHGSMRT